jgi:hypothetical protein
MANIESSRRKQPPPLSKRQAFLERQRLVAERAAKKAEKPTQALPAVRTQDPRSGKGSRNLRLGAAKGERGDFASKIARAEAMRPRWDGAGLVRWQSVGSRGIGPFVTGVRIHHSKFGPGVIAQVDDPRLTIVFDGGDTRCILDSFVEVA